ncbi:ribonuclease H-like domain-containing protein, partial [Tanacetum coccineum]
FALPAQQDQSVVYPVAQMDQHAYTGPIIVKLRSVGAMAAPGQAITFPHAFTARTLHDPLLELGIWIQFVRDNNCTIEFDAYGFSVKYFMTRWVLLRCDSTGDLYPVTHPSPVPHAFLVSQHTWHKRLGHPGGGVFRRLVSNNVISCNNKKPPVLCHAC